ncbi:hypothetical protein PENANT_c040G06131 [Penicillium antarcticum]|uniref:FAD-binding FR-type domain-containing protein n=1 Tax=Penicillium antarcticum TaxID=416450 RepID=A0A1V6PSM3_9EURO|nr:uncharacterized protein N7508_000259 [Penicillium antarcticum]KAJ5319976.1 hypothetical protein N7508_000259 [Penicillium antarcticum]OQD79998.1 hypothetical protein PENANT_c040G06131 [Penicillium antarcticum]
MATAALNGWHPGEISIQRKLGYASAVSDHWSIVTGFLPEQHRLFHTSHLPFIPITTLDEDGHPWASIVAGQTGDIGFVNSPNSRTLSMNLRMWDGDPLLDTVKAWLEERRETAPERFLTAGLGIEFSTRRRNKFAGAIRNVRRRTNSEYQIDFEIIEAIGNCPKYINIRKLIPHPQTQPEVVYRRQHLAPRERLPEEVIQFILEADTVFMGTIFNPESSVSQIYPSHAGMNARSGLPGFIRVSPSDGRTVVIPDYSGNRFASSLGNIEASGVAGLTIVSFTTGDIVYLTGTAENIVGPPALKIMARHASLTSVNITGFTFVRNALPVRQQSGTVVERSPYSPKVKYLVEEAESQMGGAQQHKAKLEEAIQISHDLAVFKFKVVSEPGADDLKVRPGQAIVLDFMDWIGPPQYQHMANSAPGSINDDRVRTWTVSSAHEQKNAICFELTMRKVQGGTVTGALFNLLRRQNSKKQDQRTLFDRPISADIVGVTGDFFMGPGKLNMLLIAGGIGITPFLAMLSALAARGSKIDGDVALILATREPEIMVNLMKPALEMMSVAVNINIDIFSHTANVNVEYLNTTCRKIIVHTGRVTPELWKQFPRDKDVFICGPNGFGDSVTDGLRAAGFPLTQIHREGFY